MPKVFFTTLLAVTVLAAGAWYVITQNDVAQSGEPIVTTTDERVDMVLTLKSNAFADGESIPSKFTCDAGGNLSPQLSIDGIPAGTKSLALIMDDPDIAQSVKDQRGIDAFDHWVLFDIPPTITEIPEGGTVGTAGANGIGVSGYMGPCPPKGVQPTEHAYSFRLYALDTTLSLEEGVTKKDVQAAMAGRILEETELIGKYERK